VFNFYWERVMAQNQNQGGSGPQQGQPNRGDQSQQGNRQQGGQNRSDEENQQSQQSQGDEPQKTGRDTPNKVGLPEGSPRPGGVKADD
jgi:hypothetical protein